jgi:hypothetical protein
VGLPARGVGIDAFPPEHLGEGVERGSLCVCVCGGGGVERGVCVCV